MPINRVQFQRGMPLSEFMQRFGSEEQCARAVEGLRWPRGFRCPKCDGNSYWRVARNSRFLLQCRGCRHQASGTAGTMMDSSKLPLRTWLLAMYLISQAKTGLSSLSLKRQLGVSYRTAWLLHHKIMQSMADADASKPLAGDIQLDDAYLGGERPGTGGRGSENKVPFVAAVAFNEKGRPTRAKMNVVKSFSSSAITQWAQANLAAGSDVRSDGLACFSGVIDAGCAHSFIVVGKRKPRDMPEFKWVNTVLGNLKTMINGAHKHFSFWKYPHRYLGAFCYRFNNRFDLHSMVSKLLGNVVCSPKLPEWLVRQPAELCT